MCFKFNKQEREQEEKQTGALSWNRRGKKKPPRSRGGMCPKAHGQIWLGCIPYVIYHNVALAHRDVGEHLEAVTLTRVGTSNSFVFFFLCSEPLAATLCLYTWKHVYVESTQHCRQDNRPAAALNIAVIELFGSSPSRIAVPPTLTAESSVGRGLCHWLLPIPSVVDPGSSSVFGGPRRSKSPCP